MPLIKDILNRKKNRLEDELCGAIVYIGIPLSCGSVSFSRDFFFFFAGAVGAFLRGLLGRDFLPATGTLRFWSRACWDDILEGNSHSKESRITAELFGAYNYFATEHAGAGM